MNIWIFQTGEPLHIDGDNIRAMRAMNLTNTLISLGHNVTLWSSDFYHQKKKHRFGKFTSIKYSELLTINLIPSCGYKANIGIMRLVDHAILSFNLYKALKNQKSNFPDASFIGFPPIETAAVFIRWLKNNGIPSIIDVKDQWPTYIVDAFPIYIRSFIRIILFPYFILTRRALRDATVHCSMSESFLKWMEVNSGDSHVRYKLVSPLTTSRTNFSPEAIIVAEQFWTDKGIIFNENFFTIIFVGSLSPAFDFRIIKDVAERMQNENSNFRFILCGHGSEAVSVNNMMAGLNNVLMPGWIDSCQLKVLAENSNATIAPYINSPNFVDNIPNKIIDSLSFSLPIFTTLSGETKLLIDEYKVGFYIDNSEIAYNLISQLQKDFNIQCELAHNAEKLYNEKFSFIKVYERIVDVLESISK